MQINTHHAFSPSATATASATVAEVFLSTATASATAQKFTFGRPLVELGVSYISLTKAPNLVV